MKYYVVGDGYVISATCSKGKWHAFRTYIRVYATPLAHKHALAFAYMATGSKVIGESDFPTHKLKGE